MKDRIGYFTGENKMGNMTIKKITENLKRPR